MKQRRRYSGGQRVIPDAPTVHGNVFERWVPSNGNLVIPITVPHLIVSLFGPRGSFLLVLLREERQAGDVQNRNELSKNGVQST